MKAHARFILSLVFFLLAGPDSLASQQNLGERYRGRLLAFLNDLERFGVSHFADVRDFGSYNPRKIQISQIVKKTQELRFVSVEDFSKPPGATRWTAFYEPQASTVWINAKVHHDEAIIPSQALHEVLGALGYNDLDNQTTFMATLFVRYMKLPSHLRDSTTERYFRNNLLRTNLLSPSMLSFPFDLPNTRLEVAGSSAGGSRVGGGGDADALKLKLDLWELIYKEARPFQRPTVSNLLHLMVLEVADSGSMIEYLRGSDNVSARASAILVPRDFLIESPNRALRELHHYLASRYGGLFPNTRRLPVGFIDRCNFEVTAILPLGFSTLHPVAKQEILDFANERCEISNRALAEPENE